MDVQRDWYFVAEQLMPAPHLAYPEGCAALRLVLFTVPRVSRSLREGAYMAAGLASLHASCSHMLRGRRHLSLLSLSLSLSLSPSLSLVKLRSAVERTWNKHVSQGQRLVLACAIFSANAINIITFVPSPLANGLTLSISLTLHIQGMYIFCRRCCVQLHKLQSLGR